MWHEEQAKLLRFEIESHLFNAIEQEHLRELVKIPLTTARRALSHECDSSWPLLPLMVCEGICGRYQHALPAAAALQLLLAAGDVFDDIEDEDSPGSLPAKYGQAIATNAATALIILAEKALAHLVNEETTRQAGICILQKVNEFYTTACIGQHLDLTSNECPPISEDRYFHIAAMKSASQVECACHVGALLATQNPALINAFSMFGHNLGMAAQIANDLQGITQGDDIIMGTKTLPVIYALNQADDKGQQLLAKMRSGRALSVAESSQIRKLLFALGAIHYAMIKLDIYKQRALDALTEAQMAGARVEHLKTLLPQI